jgi:DNA-binding LacI/PurR family transcriptional regulator
MMDGKGAGRAITLADVARQAGVAASTVSYVLSGKRSISGSTRDRVERAIELLGYHPNAGARALASQRSNIIALMVPLRSDMFVPVIMEIVMAVTTAAREHNQDILLLTKDEGPAGVRRIAASSLVDAVIVMDVELDDERIPVLREMLTPAVLIGMPRDAPGISCVDLDFDATGALCADHLADLGHLDVAMIGESESVYARHTGFAVHTADGFLGQARARGLRAVLRPCDGGNVSVAGVLGRLFEERPRTTGIVVQNEAAIPSLLSLLRSSGRAVPEDISVLAICPDQVALQASPQLTSVPIPAEAMGRQAVELVIAQLAGEPPEGRRLLPPVLALRASTAAASPPDARSPSAVR